MYISGLSIVISKNRLLGVAVRDLIGLEGTFARLLPEIHEKAAGPEKIRPHHHRRSKTKQAEVSLTFLEAFDSHLVRMRARTLATFCCC